MKSTIPAPSPTDATATIWLPKWVLHTAFPERAGVLRAGYGLQYGPILPSSYAWIRSNPPANEVLMIQQPNLIQALTAAGGTSFAGATQGRAFLTVLDPNMVLPYSQPVQRRLGAGVARILARATGLCGEPHAQADYDEIPQPRADCAGNDDDRGQRRSAAARPERQLDSRHRERRAMPGTTPPWPASSCRAGKACMSMPRIGSASPWTMAPTSPIRDPCRTPTASGSMKRTKT